jgi:histidine triad (HIT) family protein
MLDRRSVLQSLGAALALPAAQAQVPQTAQRDHDCVFCRIEAGEVEGVVVWRDECCIAIADKFPRMPGHTLLMPRRHVRNVYDMEPELAGRLYALAPRLARTLKRSFGADGVTCLQNNDAAGGQDVFHYHMHFVPRTAGVELWRQLRERPEMPIDERERLFAPVREALAG